MTLFFFSRSVWSNASRSGRHSQLALSSGAVEREPAAPFFQRHRDICVKWTYIPSRPFLCSIHWFQRSTLPLNRKGSDGSAFSCKTVADNIHGCPPSLLFFPMFLLNPSFPTLPVFFPYDKLVQLRCVIFHSGHFAPLERLKSRC